MHNEARLVLFHHQVVHVAPTAYPPLDTLGAIFYVAFFAAVTLLTVRRPAYGACALVLVEPFAYYQNVLGTTITLPKVAILAVLIGLWPYRNAFAPIADKASWRILTCAVLVLCATLLSYAHASYHVPVIREAMKTLEYILVFCVVVAAYRLDPQRILIRKALLASTVAVCVVALCQELLGAPSGLFVNGHAVPRIAGLLEGPNQLAGYFDVALPLVLACTLEEATPLARAALALAVATDILTFSRAGILCAAIAFCVVAYVLRARIRAAILPAICGIAGGLGVAGAWGLAVGSFDLFRLWSSGPSYAGGVGTRSELWHAAWVLWRRHPIFGVGAGNFELEIPLTGLYGVRTHANSLYIQSLVEGGIPLFAATLWLVYTSIATFVRDRLQSPFVVAALAASVALALHQTVDCLTFYPKVGMEWWILLALGAAELPQTARVEQPCA